MEPEQQGRHRNPELLGVLTDREWEILALQCEGLGYKEIGAKLGITESTVNNHLAHAREKLGARNGMEAARKAFL